jgi:hypothetical protein
MDRRIKSKAFDQLMLRAISGKTASLQMVYAREHCNKLYTKYIDVAECLIKLVGKAP